MPLIRESLWRELEEVVCETIWNRYLQLANDNERRLFCEQLRVADSDRLHNYGFPRSGESYALWHHMLRMDNICVALQEVQERLKASHKAYALRGDMPPKI